MPESFVQDAAARGFPPDWAGDNVSESISRKCQWDGSEYPTTCSAEELEEDILRNLWEGRFDWMDFENQRRSAVSDGFVPLENVHGLGADDEDLRAYGFMFRSYAYGELFFSARFLIQVLERTRLPVFIEEEPSGWLVWEPNERVLRVPDLMINDNTPVSGALTEEDDPQAHALLCRCLTTVDHGQKPLLVKKDQVVDVAAGGAVSVETPSFIAERDFLNYALAYVSAHGRVQVIPFSRLAQFGMPIATRGQTYIPMLAGGFRAKFDYAYLMVSAYVMAVKHVPHRIAHFRVNRELTAFQPAFRRVGSTVDTRTAGLDAAMEFLELHPYGDSVYLTTGEHPLEDSSYCPQNYLGEHWVTTTDLYAQALRTLSNFGYEVAIEYGEPTVRGAQSDEFD